jgi:hypothetical protein
VIDPNGKVVFFSFGIVGLVGEQDDLLTGLYNKETNHYPEKGVFKKFRYVYVSCDLSVGGLQEQQYAQTQYIEHQFEKMISLHQS